MLQFKVCSLICRADVACLISSNLLAYCCTTCHPLAPVSDSCGCDLQIGDRFKTLSLTLEMPFKDTIENPEPVQGWSPGRTKSFGASILNPIVDVIPALDG